MKRTKGCAHHWMIEAAGEESGGIYGGACSACGETRTFDDAKAFPAFGRSYASSDKFSEKDRATVERFAVKA